MNFRNFSFRRIFAMAPLLLPFGTMLEPAKIFVGRTSTRVFRSAGIYDARLNRENEAYLNVLTEKLPLFDDPLY